MKRWKLALLFAVLTPCVGLYAQSAAATSTSAASAAHASDAPGPTAQRTFYDPVYRLSFDYPADWNFSSRDGQISTFHLDARSATRKTRMRAVVSMPRNPFPESTFSGAYLYFSVTPHTSEAVCAWQAEFASGGKPAEDRRGGESEGDGKSEGARESVAGGRGVSESEIAGIRFAHGHDQQTDICVVQRDEIYTTRRRGSCYRFDLAINTFCGGEVSDFKDITGQQLNRVRGSLMSILKTVRFDTK